MKLKTLIRWEQLRRKPCSRLDLTDPDDFFALLYVRALDSGGASGYRLEAFRRVMEKSPQQYERQVESLRREQETMSQFMPPDADKAPRDDEPESVACLASRLIAAGTDAHFVMEELELPDARELFRAYEERRKDQLEEARLWTYLTMLPHLAEGTAKSPRDIYPFPWDCESGEEARELTETEIKAFEAFMRSKHARPLAESEARPSRERGTASPRTR